MLDINENIDKLMINRNILSILKDKEIYNIGQLLDITKTELRNFGLNSREVQHIEAKAELEGFKLRGSL